jgi:hypothetical protein
MGAGWFRANGLDSPEMNMNRVAIAYSLVGIVASGMLLAYVLRRRARRRRRDEAKSFRIDLFRKGDD